MRPRSRGIPRAAPPGCLSKLAPFTGVHARGPSWRRRTSSCTDCSSIELCAGRGEDERGDTSVAHDADGGVQGGAGVSSRRPRSRYETGTGSHSIYTNEPMFCQARGARGMLIAR